MSPQALLFEPPRGVLVVPPTAAADLDGWMASVSAQLPEGASPEAHRTVIAESATDAAAEPRAAVVLVWADELVPFALRVQITGISGLGIAQEFVRSSTAGWIGRLRAEHLGTGLERFAAPSDQSGSRDWAAVFADEDLFVQLTLTAPSFAELVTRRMLVQLSVLPALVIATDARPWRSDERFASGIAAEREAWPQLADAGATA